MTILDRIIAQKRKEVPVLKEQPLMERLEKPVPTFKENASASEKMNVIAEIKRASPSKGAIDLQVDPVQQAIAYEENGAAAISVLTDETFFNGSMKDLRAVREAVNLPILCKDFMIDKVQIDHARQAGATIILLIVAALSDEKLKELYDYACALGLEVLVEVHDAGEMERAKRLGADIIGINNRNLKSFEVDLKTTEELASMVTDPKTILVSESGMRTREDVELARDTGAKAILIGETLMRAKDLTETFHELKIPLLAKGESHAR